MRPPTSASQPFISTANLPSHPPQAPSRLLQEIQIQNPPYARIDDLGKTAVELADILERFGAPRDSLQGGFGMTKTCVRSLELYVALSTNTDYSLGRIHLRHTADPTQRQRLQCQVPLSREMLGQRSCPCREPGDQCYLCASGARPAPSQVPYGLPGVLQQTQGQCQVVCRWLVHHRRHSVSGHRRQLAHGRHKDCINIDGVKHSRIFPLTTFKPDDIVCFMLTSGWTGNSKAAGLRHSNLLSCIWGKAKHHKTMSSSRLVADAR